MRIAALVLLSISILITAGQVPVTHLVAATNGRDGHPAGLGMVVLSVLRGGVFLGAFLLLMRTGLLDRWSFSRGAQALWIALGVIGLEVACTWMQFLSIDKQVSVPFPLVFGVTATLLPLCLAVSGMMPSRGLFLAGATGSLIAGSFGMFAYRPLTAEWREARMAEARQEEESKARRIAEFASVPADAGLDRLLPFAGALEPPEVREMALARIEKIPGLEDQLAQALEGPGGLDTLYLLQERFDRLPEPVQERCWTRAGELANEIAGRIDRGELPVRDAVWKLYQTGVRLGSKKGPMRDRHRAELAAVRNAVRKAGEKGLWKEGTGWLDSYLAD